MPNARLGLACAGGVVEGAFYEIGALSALEEAVVGLDLNEAGVYVGVSSGAIVATMLAAGVSIGELAGAISGDPDSPLDMRPEHLFRPDWSEYRKRAARLPRAALASVRRFLRDPSDMGVFGAALGLGSAIPVGIFDNSPIEQFIAGVLEKKGVGNRFDAFSAILRVVAVDVDSSETVCFGTPGWESVPVSKAVQASTALPVLYRPVQIDGRHYIDGVARRTVHASRALEAGARLVFCVNPIVPADLRAAAERDDRRVSPLVDAGLPLVLSQTFRTLVHSRMRTGFRAYRHMHPEADIILLEPRIDDRSLLFSNVMSFSNRQDVCRRAYEATRDWLSANRDTLGPILQSHGMDLDHDALRRRGPGPFAAPCDRGMVASADRALDRLEQVLAKIPVN